MASSAPSSALRQLVEQRHELLVSDLEKLFVQTRERDRRECAEQINHAVRRMRQATDSEALAATLVDAAAGYSAAAAFLRIDGETARGERIRGVSAETGDAFVGLAIPLTTAAALAGAMETRDPVTAIATQTEVSADLVRVFGHPDGARVTIFPIEVRGRVRALLYCAAPVELAAAELLAQVAAVSWSAFDPVIINVPAPAPELVQLAAPAPSPTPAAARPAWEDLPGGEQQIHLKAQRFARVEIATLRLNDGHAVQAGRSRKNVYGALPAKIDALRTTFHDRFFKTCPSMVDYLHLELVRTLAQEDAELLGKDYPGPLA